jgi:hypothetical protein
MFPGSTTATKLIRLICAKGLFPMNSPVVTFRDILGCYIYNGALHLQMSFCVSLLQIGSVLCTWIPNKVQRTILFVENIVVSPKRCSAPPYLNKDRSFDQLRAPES